VTIEVFKSSPQSATVIELKSPIDISSNFSGRH